MLLTVKCGLTKNMSATFIVLNVFKVAEVCQVQYRSWIWGSPNGVDVNSCRLDK